jgi:para-nitrobenzyl esterase
MSNLENALVQVKQGRLQGCDDKGVKVFRGIPYAAPPVGELRFRAPADPGFWRGTRDATKFGAASIQPVVEPGFIEPNSQYEEDCLYLNVWTPANKEDEKLPVFMWIHGGGLVAGSGVETVCQGADFAREKGVVVVTINYRLGFFGFFSHPELTEETKEHYSGNYALLDMRKAAMWIRDNIAAFGGDPDNVTIAGQSGGAAACGAILVSPLMKGLFKHICIESGPVYWGFMQTPSREVLEQRGVSVMEKAGCKNISELRKKEAWELFDLYIKNYNIMSFNYCTDGWFLPDEIHDMMERGDFNDVDVLIGSNSQEFSVSGPDGISVESFHKYLDTVFSGNADNMKSWYPAETAVQAAKQAATVSSDIMLMGSVRIGQLCAKYGRKAFVYLNTKETENEQGKAFGCPHCAEMPYLFGNVDKGGPTPFHDYKWVEKDFAFMRQVMGYWYNFAKTGSPNGDSLSPWKAYENDYDILVLGNESHMAEQNRVKPLYDYYLSLLMEDIHVNCQKYYMNAPHLNI